MGLVNLGVGVVALATAASAVAAPHPMVMQALTRLQVAEPARADLSVAVGAAAAKYCPAKDAGAFDIATVTPATADRFVFGRALSGTLRGGWFVSGTNAPCDPAPMRFLVLQPANGPLQVTRVNRGESMAWASLIEDTVLKAALAADVALKRRGLSCDGAPTFGPIRVSERGATMTAPVFGVTYEGSWQEVWPVALCGKTVDVTVRFQADGDGGAYLNIKEQDLVVR